MSDKQRLIPVHPAKNPTNWLFTISALSLIGLGVRDIIATEGRLGPWIGIGLGIVCLVLIGWAAHRDLHVRKQRGIDKRKGPPR